jgi:hypothetical protein
VPASSAIRGHGPARPKVAHIEQPGTDKHARSSNAEAGSKRTWGRARTNCPDPRARAENSSKSVGLQTERSKNDSFCNSRSPPSLRRSRRFSQQNRSCPEKPKAR